MSILLVQPNKCCGHYSLSVSEHFQWLFSESKIKAHLAALHYYREHATIKVLGIDIFGIIENERSRQDAIEKENQEFREAVRTCKGYPDRYTGDLDLAATLWKQKYGFKGDYRHGLDCFEKAGCTTCTPYSICRKNDERRTEEQKQLARNKVQNIRRRKGNRQ